MKRTLLGTGRLTWDTTERIKGRYGFVWLMEYGDSLSPHRVAPFVFLPELFGKSGQLIAHVIEARQNTHVGDHMRGFYPEMPEIGEDIILGHGKLVFNEGCEGQITIGTKPDGASGPQPAIESSYMFVPETATRSYYQIKSNEYDRPWLEPKALYRAHEQTVELYFVED